MIVSGPGSISTTPVPAILVITLTRRSAFHGLPVTIIRVPVSILPRRPDYYGSAVREARFGYSSQTSPEQFKPYILDGKTVILSPRKVYGPRPTT